MYLKLRITVLAFVFAFAIPSFGAPRQAASHQSTAPQSGVVDCKVLEAHTSPAPAVLVVIFHQNKKQDQPRLAELLKQRSGSSAEVQIGAGAWTKVSVFRLRTAFGRGMLLLPAGSMPLKDGDTFRIRFAAAHTPQNS
jgi:hypothetical protein